MKENIKRMYDKIEPRGTNADFAASVKEKARVYNGRKKIPLAAPLAAALALAVISGGIWAYTHAPHGGAVYDDPPAESDEETPASSDDFIEGPNGADPLQRWGVFDEAGVLKARALRPITFAPDFEILENTYEGIDIEPFAIAFDGQGGMLIALGLQEDVKGSRLARGKYYLFEQAGHINGETPDYRAMPFMADDQIFAVGFYYSANLVKPGEIIFEQKGITGFDGADEFIDGYIKIKIDVSELPEELLECPVTEIYNPEYGSVTFTPLAAYYGEDISLNRRDIIMNDGTSMLSGYGETYWQGGANECHILRTFDGYKFGAFIAIDAGNIKSIGFDDVYETTAMHGDGIDSIWRKIGEGKTWSEGADKYRAMAMAEWDDSSQTTGYLHLVLYKNNEAVDEDIFHAQDAGQSGYPIDADGHYFDGNFMIQNGNSYALLTMLYPGGSYNYYATFYTVKDGKLVMFTDYEVEETDPNAGVGIVARAIPYDLYYDCENRALKYDGVVITFDFEKMKARITYTE